MIFKTFNKAALDFIIYNSSLLKPMKQTIKIACNKIIDNDDLIFYNINQGKILVTSRK